jgi:hypothetical protein
MTARENDYFLRIYAVEKEYPYATDGVKHETSTRTEVRLVAPSGNHTCNIQFSVGTERYGGEMSYDIVKGEYYYSCAVDTSDLQSLDCSVTLDEYTFSMHAKTVKTEQTISPQDALRIVREHHTALFDDLTDKYGFAGEICIRLLFEEAPYYYVSVVNRNAKVTAYLLNAESGKILAKRQS